MHCICKCEVEDLDLANMDDLEAKMLAQGKIQAITIIRQHADFVKSILYILGP